MVLQFFAEHRRLTVFIVVFVAVSIVYQFVGGKSDEKQTAQIKTPGFSNLLNPLQISENGTARKLRSQVSDVQIQSKVITTN